MINPLDYMWCIRAIAVGIRRSLPPTAMIEVDDLLDAGFVGLLDAIRRKRHERNFMSYAKMRIRGAMRDELRAWCPARVSAMRKFKSREITLFFREISDDDLSINSPQYADLKFIIATEGISERNKSIMSMYYSEGLGIKGIGYIVGVKAARISQIISEERAKIIKAME